MKFPQHDSSWYQRRLALPSLNTPLRIVIDTDAANEIDDQFALAWALLRPDRLDIQAVYAAPFSFAHRRAEMLHAQKVARAPALASEPERELLLQHQAKLQHFERMAWDVASIDLPPFNPPAQGMERSYHEILKVYSLLGQSSVGKVWRGSATYLPSLAEPVRSAAVDHLIACARATDAPLYVLALGCVTNIASALLLAPDLVERLVVVWTSGYPSHAPYTNYSFNLEQDLLASQVLLNSGVPHVYLPGYHVGAQLRLSLAEVERYVKGQGAMGDYLHQLFTENPLWPLLGLNGNGPHSWVIWDVINVAWVLNPDWVPSGLTPTPWLGADRRWRVDPERHLMREAYAVARDPIFNDFFSALAKG